MTLLLNCRTKCQQFYSSHPVLVILFRKVAVSYYVGILMLVILTYNQFRTLMSESHKARGYVSAVATRLPTPEPLDIGSRGRFLRMNSTGYSQKYNSGGGCFSRSEEVNLSAVIQSNIHDLQGNHSFMKYCQHKDKNVCRDYFLPRKTLTPYTHGFVIENPDLCSPDTEIIVIVHSLHSYVEKRSAIRETWGRVITGGMWPNGSGSYVGVRVKMKLIFVLGLSRNQTQNTLVKREDEVFHDIVQGDFIDNYHNMTLKSLLGFKWILRNCACARYLLKSDDDMFINFPLLLEILEEENMHWGVLGPRNQGSRVYRRGKWAVSLDEYPFSYYPTYHSGSAYVIDASLLEPFLSLSQHVPHIFIDDVYITGVLGRMLNATQLSHRGFAYAISKKVTSCDIKMNYVVTGIKATPKVMRLVWDQLLDGVTCPRTTTTIRSRTTTHRTKAKN